MDTPRYYHNYEISHNLFRRKANVSKEIDKNNI